MTEAGRQKEDDGLVRGGVLVGVPHHPHLVHEEHRPGIKAPDQLSAHPAALLPDGVNPHLAVLDEEFPAVRGDSPGAPRDGVGLLGVLGLRALPWTGNGVEAHPSPCR